MTRLLVSRAALLALAVSTLSVSVGCKEGGSSVDGGPVSDGRTSDGLSPDMPVCRRPPMAQCEAPPYGGSCPTRYFCPGCLCAGQAPAAACDPITNDCRRFCTGCFPAEYVSCSDRKAPPKILARCGYCFLSDAGPERCHTIGGKDAGGDPDVGANADGGPPGPG